MAIGNTVAYSSLKGLVLGGCNMAQPTDDLPTPVIR